MPRARSIISLDADLQNDPNDIVSSPVQKIEDGYDIVSGMAKRSAKTGC